MIDQQTQASIARANDPLPDLPAQLHPHCIVCGSSNPRGFSLAFILRSDDSVTADFKLDHTYAGYRDRPHGGVTSAILDASMAHWLFAHGLAGVTAELKIRFRHPIRLGKAGTAVATLKRASHPLYVLEAQVLQDGQVKAQATGKFMHKPDLVERDRGGADG